MTSMSIDQQFVEYIVKSLVSNPDAVVVERRIDEKGVVLELTVDPEDLGRVIGNGVGGSHSENSDSRSNNSGNANADDSRQVSAVPAPVGADSDDNDDRD